MKKLIPLLALGFIVLVIGGVFVLQSKKPEEDTPVEPESTQASSTQADDLQITDTQVGDGAEAVSGKKISVHYTGTLTNGTKFDSSVDRGTPFEFTLGSGQVIQGWERGFTGMKVGGKRKLVIPPALGYGASPQGSIPANSTLIFEVELLDVK